VLGDKLAVVKLEAGGSTIRIAGDGVVNDAGVTVPRPADETLVDGTLAAAAVTCPFDEAALAAAGADQPDGGACANVGCPALACIIIGPPAAIGAATRCGKAFPPGGP
jgi:hypothetical protein